MYKKYLNYVLPVFGAVVIVGSGFSSWVFSEVAPQERNITGTVVVDPMESLNATLDVSVKSFELHLDQGGVGNTDLDKGIYFTNVKNASDEVSNTNQSTLEVTLTYTLNSASDFSYWENVKTYYSVSYTLPEVVSTYIAISNVDRSQMTEVNATDPKSHVYTQKFTMAFTYVADKKPTTAEQYTTMADAFANAADTNIVVNITAETEIA